MVPAGCGRTTGIPAHGSIPTFPTTSTPSRPCGGIGRGRSGSHPVTELVAYFDHVTQVLELRDHVAPRALVSRSSSTSPSVGGMAVHGFPNMLFVYGPQSAAAFCNGPVCAELQGDWVAELLGFLRRRNHVSFDVLEATGPAWSEELARFAEATLFGRADSWYMGANVPGKPRQLLNHPSTGTYLQRPARLRRRFPCPGVCAGRPSRPRRPATQSSEAYLEDFTR